MEERKEQKERWKKIQTSILIIVFVILGVLEYIQLMHSFDLPQVILVMPVVGALSVITLRKFSLAVPVCTILLSCAYQIVGGSSNAVNYLQTDAASIPRVILYVLPICLAFELIGMGGGALIRVLINRKKSTAVGVVCLIAGLLLVFGPYILFFRNPLYPIQARMRLSDFAEENYTDYEIAGKEIYFDLATSDYRCRVSMSDGALRLVYFDENGAATDRE